MEMPTKPTSGSWVKDAEALLEMGATSIDAATVRGLLEEIAERDVKINECEVIERYLRWRIGRLRDRDC
jgi:hypothetical protein